MKKIVIASCILLAVGCVLAIGGWSAGGRLYGSYYNGAWHPVTETIRAVTDDVTDSIRHHGWDDHDWNDYFWGDAFHGDSYGDNLDDFIDLTIDDAVDSAIGSAIGSIASDPQPTAAPSLPSQQTDMVRELDLTLAGDQFVIDTGDDFALTGDFTLRQNKLEDGEWEVALSADGGRVTLTLPEGLTYRKVSIEAGAADVQITAPLSVFDGLDLAVGGGSITADSLDARELDLDAGAGSITATLAGGYTYGVEGKCSMGYVTLDGKEILSGAAGVTRIDTTHGSDRKIDLNVAAGTIQLTIAQ